MKKKRFLPTIRRTKEQIKIDDDIYAFCSSCKIKLKTVLQPRTTAKRCASCRGDVAQNCTSIRQQFIESQKNPTQPSEDELVFTDCPKAVKESDMDRSKRYIRKTQEFSFGVSDISDIGPKLSNHYRYVKKEYKINTKKKK